MSDKSEASGVSSVVGIILVVAVTVTLVALASNFVFDIGETGQTDTADATVELKQSGSQIEASIIRESNIEQVRIVGPNGDTKTITETGESVSLQDGNGQYTAIGVTESGAEQVLVTTTTQSDVENPTPLAGEVEVNPVIPGAQVTVETLDGTVVGTDTTNPNGEFRIEAEGAPDILDASVEVNGFSNPNVLSGEPMFAQKTKRVNKEQGTINFDFDINTPGTTVVNQTVDGTRQSVVVNESVATIEKNGSQVEVSVNSETKVDEFKIAGPASTEKTVSPTGQTASLQDGSGEYEVVAVSDNGEKTISSVTTQQNVPDADGDTVSGTVTDGGTPIANAEVKVIDTDDSVLNSTTTDSSGQYTLTVPSGRSDTATTIVDTNGVNNLYASASLPFNSADTTTDISASQFTSRTATVNGTTVEVVYEGDGSSQTPFGIANIYQLQAVNEDKSSSYQLVDDIDATVTQEWNPQETVERDSVSSNGGEVFFDFTGIQDFSVTDVNSGENVTDQYEISGPENGRIKRTSGSGFQDVRATATFSTEEDTRSGFDPIGETSFDSINFDGSLDGQGHTIDGLVIDRGSDIGLFGFSKGDIRNVALTNVNVTASGGGANDIGGLVGRKTGGTVENVFVSGTVTATDSQVGGVIGKNADGPLKNLSSSATVTGENRVGGVVGQSNDDVLNSYASGTVTGTNPGDFDGNSDKAGGLIGEQREGTVSNSSSTSDVTGNGRDVGGLIGDFNGGTVEDSSASGSADGDQNVGGLVGRNDGPLSNVSASGDVTSAKGTVGGLAGESDGDVSNVSASGDVTMTGPGSQFSDDVGGLIGIHEGGTLSNASATGDVSSGDTVGGLVGENRGTVSNASARGSVTGDGDTGGLVGLNLGGTVENTFASGTVTGDNSSSTAGLVGEQKEDFSGNGASLNESYFDNSSTGTTQATAVGFSDTESTVGSEVIGLRTSQMQGDTAKANMGAFDFQNTWQTVTGEFPQLRALND